MGQEQASEATSQAQSDSDATPKNEQRQGKSSQQETNSKMGQKAQKTSLNPDSAQLSNQGQQWIVRGGRDNQNGKVSKVEKMTLLNEYLKEKRKGNNGLSFINYSQFKKEYLGEEEIQNPYLEQVKVVEPVEVKVPEPEEATVPEPLQKSPVERGEKTEALPSVQKPTKKKKATSKKSSKKKLK